MTKRRVVVTGLGMVSPLGLTAADTWQGILASKSGVHKIEHFDASKFSAQICATVKNFNADAVLSSKDQRKTAMFVQYAMQAAREALDDCGLDVTEQVAERFGVAVGSGIGGLPMIERNYQAFIDGGPRKISPFFIPGAIINMAAGYLSIHYGLKGPNVSIVTACTTGAHNIGYAARTIAYGDADIMLAGGTEKASSPLGIGGFAAMRALSTRNDEPEKASRPWDQERDGFVLGDGAGVLVLEEYEHAKARGAKIYAELAGFGMSADASHMTLPDQEGKGAARAMAAAIKDAGCAKEDIGYINAHGTSTPAGDGLEVLAAHKTFAEHAKNILMSSTKSMTGHLLGAAGAVEAIFSVLALKEQVAPPTINLDNPSEDCDLDFVAHEARQVPLQMTLSNSFGFGGTNASLIFKQV